MTVQHQIPTIDISAFLDQTASEKAREAVVAEVRDACMTYGFFQLIGHGIPLAIQEHVLRCAKVFFDQPLEKKQALGMDKAMGQSNRGYERIGGQALQADMLPDLKEGFYIGREVPADDPRAGQFHQGPNLWPEIPEEEFRVPLSEYYRMMIQLDYQLLNIIALGLPFSNDIFEEFKKEPAASLRLLHYPPQISIDERQFGAGAHTDFGCMTLLLQQPGQEGLQVFYPPTKEWIPVPAAANTFVVNIGDLLQLWTKGQYRSALHRVLNATNEDRYSVPFFYNGNLACKLAPLDGSSDVNTLTVEEHVKRKFQTSYAV